MHTTDRCRTARLNVNDGRGLPVRQVAYLRKNPAEPVRSLLWRESHDAAGRLIAQWDPRLAVSGAKANMTSVYTLSGIPLKVDSVDAGQRVSLPGLAGEALHDWDARGQHWHSVYDDQLRLLSLAENGHPPLERYRYANATADAGDNLRGQMIALEDASGSLAMQSFGLLGQALSQTRTFDDDPPHLTCQTFGPLNQPLTHTDAGGHLQQLRYDVAGQLTQVSLLRAGENQPQVVLQDARFNAAGQLIEQLTSNQVLSRWRYEAASGRLSEVLASVPGQAVLQHDTYTYDPVGNVLRIDDRTFQPVYFANQYMDGSRTFSYDSLHRLTSASGHDALPSPDLPGRPSPSDPNDLRNYTQDYDYDDGDNLIKLVHGRDAGGYTRQMFVDPTSNRALRRAANDPEPDFAAHFDAHGNQIKLQHGPGLQWNTLDQLQQITLLKHDNGLADDREIYLYSQGERVFKRHETHTTKTMHFQQVRYLPGLEIRTRDNGEELHVILLPGNVRCLHWRQHPPAGVDNNQLRYSLNDHLGSSLLELDQQARIISRETYYPFGGTALWLPASGNAVDYKTMRYSGKEMDVSGLYYYGQRYYAPWLQRWASADPAGDVDGLNLYAFVANSPLRYVDITGNGKQEVMDRLLANTPEDRLRRQAHFHFTLLKSVSLGVRDIEQQLFNHRTGNSSAAVSTAKRTGFFLAEKGISFGAGVGLTAAGAAIGIPAGPLGMVIMGAAGFAVSKALSATTKSIGKQTGLNTSISFQPGLLKTGKLLKEVRAETGPVIDLKAIKAYDPRRHEGRELLKKQGMESGQDIVLAAAGKIPYVGPAIKAIPGTIDILNEVNAIGHALSHEQIDEVDKDIHALIGVLQVSSQRLIERATEAKETELLGRSLERVVQKTDKRIQELRNLRTVLHSRSARITAV